MISVAQGWLLGSFTTLYGCVDRLVLAGNSARSVDFATRLVKKFAFHHFDNLAGGTTKIDPRRPKNASKQEVS